MSSPYQSNILRFVVGQYRAGVDRHRRAVMNTRSAVALGFEAGSVVAMTSVYAAIRGSQSAGRKLRQSVMKRRLLSTFSKMAGQISASNPNRPGRDESGGRFKLWVSRLPLLRLSVASDLEQDEIVSSAGHIDSLPVSAAMTEVIGIIAQSFEKVAGSAWAAVGRVMPVWSIRKVQKETVQKKIESGAAIALTSALYPGMQSSDSFSNQVQGSLVWSMRSFWVAVLAAVVNLKPRWRIRRLKSAFAALPGSFNDKLLRSQRRTRLEPESTKAEMLPSAKVEDSHSVSVLQTDLDAGGDGFLDAKVVETEYIEHPLETALKWIDRILTWIERWWQVSIRRASDVLILCSRSLSK